MSEMRLWQPGFTCNACGIFTKNIGRTQKGKNQEIQDIFIKKEIRQGLLLRWYGLWIF